MYMHLIRGGGQIDLAGLCMQTCKAIKKGGIDLRGSFK